MNGLRPFFIFILILFCCILHAQDKIYLMSGECRLAKVVEVGPDYITIALISESGALVVDGNETLLKRDIILIEYKNGFVEVYTVPLKSSVYNANGTMRKELKKDNREFLFNFASVNSLALCNADLSAFFEHLNKAKKVGFGFMGAYNFNQYVTLPNGFLTILYNAKKNYDLGAFINFYPGHFKRRTTFYFGLLTKYTSFNFSRVEEQKTTSGTNIKYVPAKGSQLATLVTVGTHSDLGGNFFLKTMFGIGAFKLKGDYRSQYNYLRNQNNPVNTPTYTYTYLLKVYLGLNFGFNF